MRLILLTNLILLPLWAFCQSSEVDVVSSSSTPAFRLPFNSPYPDFSPVLSWDGNTLYFAKDNTPGNIGASNLTDIWYTRRSGNLSWTPPINIGRPLNNDGHNIPIAISPLEDQLSLAYVRPDGQYSFYEASPSGRMWQRPTEMRLPWIKNRSFLAAQIKSFHISYDQRILLFLAETGNGCGQLDIYVSIKDNKGEWAYPFNIGPTLNSDFNECSVFLAADNQSLYFSSNGHGGEGGYDIFMSKRLDNSWVQWTTPVNLGPAINSLEDELNPAMSLIGDELFFNRKTASGEQDIFSSILAITHRPSPQHIIHGKLNNQDYTKDFQLQVETTSNLSPAVLQSSKGNYLTILPNQGSYLLYRTNPKGTFSESLPFFQQAFFDNNSQEYQKTIQRNSAYQERETLIQQLKNDRVQLKKEIKQLEIIESQYLTTAKQEIATSLEQLQWDEEEEKILQLLKQKYEKLSVGLVPGDSTQTGQEQNKPIANNSDPVVDKDAHFKKQKERLRQQLAKRKNTGFDSSSPGQFTSKGPAPIIPFDQLLLESLYGLINENVVSQWTELDQENFESRLLRLTPNIGEEEVNRLKKYGLPLNENNNTFLKSISSFLISERPLMFPWQRDAESDMRTLLASSFTEQLPALIQGFQKQVLDNKIMLASKRHKAFLLYQKIQSAINLQISIEKKIESTPASASVEASNETPANNSQLIQHHNFDLIPLEIGTSIPLPGIVFEPNTSRLSSLSESEVNRLVEFLETYPEYKIDLGVFSYGDVSHSLALDLAAQRVEVLSHVILGQGIAEDRIFKKAYGKKEVIDFKYSWRNNIVILKIVE